MKGAVPAKLMITSAFKQVSWIESFRSAADALGSSLRIFAASTDPESSPACLLADGAVGVPPAEHPSYVERLLAACIRLEIDLLVPGSPRELLKLAASRPLFEANGTTVAVSGHETVALSRDPLALDNVAVSAGAMPRGLVERDDVVRRPNDFGWPMVVVPRYWLDHELKAVRLNHPRELPRIPPTAPVLLATRRRGWRTVVSAFFNEHGELEWRGAMRTGTLRGGSIPFAETIDDNAATDLVDRMAPHLTEAAGAVIFDFCDDGGGNLTLENMVPVLPKEFSLVDRAGSALARRVLLLGTDGPTLPGPQWRAGVRYLSYPSSMIVVRAKGTDPQVATLQ